MSAALRLPVRSPKLPQRAGDGLAEAGLVRAARRRGHGVAVGMEEPVLAGAEPGDGPFEFLPVKLDLRGEGGGDQKGGVGGGVGQIVGKTAGVVKHRFGRHRIVVRQQRRIAPPADLDPGIEIGLRARHAVQGRRPEPRLFAENLGVRGEGDAGAAAVRGGADLGKRSFGDAARKALPVERLLACDLDQKFGGQRVHHRRADTVQPA